MATEVPSKKVLLKDYVKDFLSESDMVASTGKIQLKLPDEVDNAVLVKNLYLSCDPYIRKRMSKLDQVSYIESLIPGKPISGYGVSKIVDSKYSGLKEGDLVLGITGWYVWHKHEEEDFIVGTANAHVIPQLKGRIRVARSIPKRMFIFNK